MPEITDSSVNSLHERTGTDLMDCEKVLVETHGDLELAMSSMCIAEQASACEKNDNFARNGIITIQKRGDGSATMLELNRETDYVAYDSTFEAFASHVASVALEDHILDINELRERFKDDCLALSSRLGERIVIRRIAATEGTYTTSYLHYNLHIGVLVSGSIANEELLQSVAMHIAVMEPEYIRPEDFPPELVQQEQQKQLLHLRRAAVRVLSSKPSSLTSRTRTFTSLSTQIPRCTLQRTSVYPLQRRFLADEAAATQSEPEADGAAEAEHGDNSIVASSEAAETTEPPKSEVEAVEQVAGTAAAEGVSATEEAGETARSTAESVSDAARSAAESVGAAASTAGQTLSGAAGFGDTAAQREGVQSSNTVYVGNLFFDVTGQNLEDEFKNAGEVVNAKVILDNRGLSKGYGYVEYTTPEAAAAAIQKYNLQNFEGRRLSVQYSIQRSARSIPRPDRPDNPPSRTLFIGNMSFDMSDRDLNNLFREVKNVVDVRVAIDRRTGQPRGFAHADFKDVSSAEAAMVGLKGKVICGRSLRVDFSTSTGRVALGGARGVSMDGARD